MEVAMGKDRCRVVVLTALLGALLTLGGTKAVAEVHVNINLGPPPVIVAEPPAVVMVPRSQVYFVPDPEIDIFFYSGYWWSPRGDRWYRARAYSGPWATVERRYVPAPVYRVPRNYRVVYEREQHIPYGRWKKQGKHYEKEERKEWKESQKEQKHGRGHDHD
jgi:hypothetical protein